VVELLDDLFPELRRRVAEMVTDGPHHQVEARQAPVWPRGRRGNVVLKADTAVELGSPTDASVAFLLWTGRATLVRDGVVTLVGPDVGDADAAELPYARVVLLAVSGCSEERWCDLHRELELVRFGLDLDGYMMRAVSQRAREWSRISRRAVETGFSLLTMGAQLYRLYRSAPHVDAAEVLLVTSSGDDVRRLAPIAEQAIRRVAALDKMSAELELACDTCEYRDVCSEVEDLRRLRRARRRADVQPT
jgi:CO dehydrogenase/acetyl-CoA synthase beta subunit